MKHPDESISSAITMQFQPRDPDDADVFVDEFADGLSGVIGDPVTVTGKLIICDICGAQTGTYPTFALARAEARDCGWARTGTDDMCSTCSGRRYACIECGGTYASPDHVCTEREETR